MVDDEVGNFGLLWNQAGEHKARLAKARCGTKGDSDEWRQPDNKELASVAGGGRRVCAPTAGGFIGANKSLFFNKLSLGAEVPLVSAQRGRQTWTQ